MTATTEIQVIPLASITTDTYQREHRDSIVQRIVDQFDIAQWDLPKVSLRGDGTHIVMMGQHRVEAARRLDAAGNWPFSTPAGMLEVIVVIGLPDKQAEANLYLADARNKVPLSPFDKHRGAIDGGDPMAIEIQAALDGLGIPLVRRQRKANGHSIVAITSLNRIWGRGQRHPKGGDFIVRETLRLASRWDPNDIYRFDGFILEGLAAVVLETHLAGGKTTRLERFVKNNQAITVAGWARRWAAARGMSTNIPAPYAEVIREHM